RHARRAWQHDQPRDELLDPEPLEAGLRAEGRRRLRRRLRPRRGARARGVALPRDPPRRLEPRGLRLRNAGPRDAPALGAPREERRRGRRADGVPARRARLGARDARAERRGARADPRADRPPGPARPRGAQLARSPAPVPPMAAPLHTKICDLLGMTHPIVQTGMGWVAVPELTAAASNAGAFGFLAAATIPPPE